MKEYRTVILACSLLALVTLIPGHVRAHCNTLDGPVVVAAKATNKEFAKNKGYISRRLLKPVKSGSYVAIVEHESQETFMAMHNSPGHYEAGKRVAPLFNGNPTPKFYEVIVE